MGLAPSPGQERIWRIERLVRGRPYLHTGRFFRCVGDLDVVALRAAFAAVQQRHHALRVGFRADGDTLRVVEDAPAVAVRLVDSQSVAPMDAAAEPAAIAERLHREPFPFDGEPLLRVDVLVLGPREHILVVTLHRLIADGTSLEVLMADVDAAYRAVLASQPPDRTPRPSYFIVATAETADQPDGLQYWEVTLAGLSGLRIGDREAAADERPRAHFSRLPLDPAFEPAVRRVARAGRTTPFVAVTAGFVRALADLIGCRDIGVATMSENRLGTDHDMVIGPMADAMLIRVVDPASLPLIDLVTCCRRVVTEAIAHGQVPFVDVVAMLQSRGLPLREIATVSLAVSAGAWRPRLGAIELTLLPEPDRAPVVRAGELDVEFVLWPEPAHCRVNYDAARMSEQFVRSVVEACASVILDHTQ